MRQSAIEFKSGNLSLEGVLATPENPGSNLPGVVVCHPHPLFGGNMNNNVVLAVCQDLVDLGFVTCRFNFRGVESSEGSFSKGEDERKDVAAALSMLGRWPGVNKRRLGLAGYSFGAAVIIAGLPTYKAARAFALISPTLVAVQTLDGTEDLRPKLFVGGDMDKLVPHVELKEKVDAVGTSAGLQVISGADHSWVGHEKEASDLVARFLAGNLIL